MAIIAEKSVLLLLVIGVLQVLYSQAQVLYSRHTQFVFGPREHLDSGQVSPTHSLTPSLRRSLERNPPAWTYNAESYEDYYDYEDNGLLLPHYKELLQEGKRKEAEKKELDSDEFSEEDSDESSDVKSDEYSEESSEDSEESGEDSEESSEDSEESGEESGEDSEESNEKSVENEDDNDEDNFINDVPLRRVRRRIIPVGKAIERRRGGHNPYGRSRNPWSQPHYRTSEPVMRRTGPTGSADLFHLFPDLAPPEWKAKRGIKTPSSKETSIPQVRDSETVRERSRKEVREENSQSDERANPHAGSTLKKTPPKRNSKLSKRIKEEIAVFAERHGVNGTITHFESRVNVPLRSEMVEKFLRRYQNRIQRRANRS